MGENILEDDEEKKECRPGKPAMFVSGSECIMIKRHVSNILKVSRGFLAKQKAFGKEKSNKSLELKILNLQQKSGFLY